MHVGENDEDTAMISHRENTSPWEPDEIVRFVLRVFGPICIETQLSRERVASLSELVTGTVCLSSA